MIEIDTGQRRGLPGVDKLHQLGESAEVVLQLPVQGLVFIAGRQLQNAAKIELRPRQCVVVEPLSVKLQRVQVAAKRKPIELAGLWRQSGIQHTLRIAGGTLGQRRAAERRFTRWRSLSDERRQLVRERWAIYRDLSPEEQRRIRENFQRYRELRKERQQMLRERYRNMPPEQRQRVRDRLKDRPRRRQ